MWKGKMDRHLPLILLCKQTNSRIHISERQKLKAKENVDLAMKTAQEVCCTLCKVLVDGSRGVVC